MNKTGIKKQVLEEIAELAQKHGVEKIVLFGSRARGDYHRASDIDLALYGGDITMFTLDVEDTTSTLLTFDVIDMIKTLEEGFVKTIEKEGVVIYEKVW